MTTSPKNSTLLWIPLSGPWTSSADLNYKQPSVPRLTFLRRCNNIAGMSESCRAWPCWADLSFFAASVPKPSQMHGLNREPTPEGAAVSTTSGNCFSDHILPAKPPHHSLFFFLTNYSQLPSLYLEWEESCLQNLRSYVYTDFILYATLP